MTNMSFFNPENDHGWTDFKEAGEGETKQSVLFTSVPATAPIEVEAATLLVAAFRDLSVESLFMERPLEGFIGRFRYTIIYEGREYPLDYAGFPRALDLRVDDQIQTPELISEMNGAMFGQAYTLPLANNRSFLIHPGLSAQLRLDRDLTAPGCSKDAYTIASFVEIHEEMQVESRHVMLRRYNGSEEE